MAADIRRYHLFSRNPRRPGLTVLAAVGVEQSERAALATKANCPVIFADIQDIERASTQVLGPDGQEIDLPDAAMAAYRLFLARDEVPLKRLRFMLPGGEVQVQGEYFRSVDNSQVWREATPPVVRPMRSQDLSQALGPIIGIGREDVLGTTWLEPGGTPVVAILVSNLAALKAAKLGKGAATWVRAHGDISGDFRYVIMSPESTSPLSDGHLRLIGSDFSPLPIDGTVAACGLVAHWSRTPTQMSLTAEIGDGNTVQGRISIWVEGQADAPDRLSIAGHVRLGDQADLG